MCDRPEVKLKYSRRDEYERELYARHVLEATIRLGSIN